jgi:hypothetical protein
MESDFDIPVLPHSGMSRTQFSTRMRDLQTKHKLTASSVYDILSLIQDLVPQADLPSYHQIHSNNSVEHLFAITSVGKNEFYSLNLEHQLSIILSRNFLELTASSISVIFFMDGAPLIKSANYSFWPIFLAIHDLPLSLRFHFENLIVAGIWFYGKPDWSLFLPPILLNIQSVTSVTINGSVKNVQLKVRGLVTDLPARASILHMKQFNGRYSCLYCEIQGKWLN